MTTSPRIAGGRLRAVRLNLSAGDFRRDGADVVGIEHFSMNALNNIQYSVFAWLAN
jgi:hypothetical protein